jgi:DNA-binding response OmpR family regulator
MNDPKKLNVLVVEDDPDSRTAICAILETLGYDALDFPTAKSALAGIINKKIDVALLDIMMPEMNGYELLQELRKIPEYADLPVIMITAKDTDSEILEGYQVGADYYITKPFTAKQIEYGIRLFIS